MSTPISIKLTRQEGLDPHFSAVLSMDVRFKSMPKVMMLAQHLTH